MGAPRGQRNAAREKHWPGDRADRLREMKRDYERFSYGGTTNWRAVEEEANKLLPDMPTIEWAENITPQLAVNIGGSRRLRLKETVPVEKFARKLERCERSSQRAEQKLIAAQNKKVFEPREPAPLSTTPIVFSPIKHPVNICDRCGGPRGGATSGAYFGLQVKHYCRACYRLNAIDRRNAALDELKENFRNLETKKQAIELRKIEALEKRNFLLNQKEKLAEEYFESSKKRDAAMEELIQAIDGYNYWVDDFHLCIPKEMPDFDGGNWISPVAENKMKDGSSHVFIRSVPDIADDVIEAIEAAEFAHGKPFVFIPPPENRPNKPLYNGKNSVVPMFGHREQNQKMRYRRPKFKTLRGQWA